MSDLPAARETELEQFGETLFPFVGLWTFWWKVYTNQATYYRRRAEALEKLTHAPERAKEYRRREALFAGWANAVNAIATPALTVAEIVAATLGGTFVDGLFKAPEAEPPRQ